MAFALTPHNANTPSITNAAYASSIYDGTGAAMGLTPFGPTTAVISPLMQRAQDAGAFVNAVREFKQDHNNQRQQEKQVTKSTMRMVQVFIADPNDNVPLDDRMIYRGSQHLTDATDQELFFEINIMELLTAHNAKRVKIVDKTIKDRVEYLEPVKIRDLRMVVVNVASF